MVRSLKWVSVVSVLVLMLGAASVALAGEIAKGTVRSTAENQIVVTDEKGKDWTYSVADTALMFCPEHKDPRITDFKTGAKVSVLSEKKGEGYQAMAILHRDGTYRDAGLGCGKVKRIADMQIIITDENAKDWTYEVTDLASIRINKKDVDVASFKTGDPVVFVYAKKGDKFNLLNLSDCPKP